MSGKQLIVIGGGAAGFFCAVNAARMNPGLKVTILEKTNKLLSKVRISGGGRCNVTHALFDPVEMSRRYPRGQNFVKKTFHQFFTTDTIRWFEQRGVELKAEKDGRMFPITDSSQTIVDCLMREANLYGIEIRMNAEVKAIKGGDRFELVMTGGQQLYADFLCIACGGYPKASMFEWLAVLGHSFSAPVPSLFTFNLPRHPITALMGVSVEKARVKIEGTKLAEEGPVLITHWGLSGPAVLKLSAWGARALQEMDYSFKVHINWLPSESEQQLKETFQSARKDQASKKLFNHHAGALPGRLWQFLLEASGIGEDTRFSGLTAKMENALIRNLVDYVVEVKGKTTFKEEFVTAGGISLSEVDANTMMSRKLPRLYFAGEILDVDGVTGGFNFQHAWTSAWIAAKAMTAG
ncbi:MAG TPA: NAD(P)/FAD-dependent oxidoreductase [Flavisolibacter sp.]|nr:NAD(P)/FAD-dependent oxidoreductase [Flavisolibacter sp.]